MPKFVSKTYTKDSPADHNYANDLELRIADAIDPMDKKTQFLPSNGELSTNTDVIYKVLREANTGFDYPGYAMGSKEGLFLIQTTVTFGSSGIYTATQLLTIFRTNDTYRELTTLSEHRIGSTFNTVSSYSKTTNRVEIAVVSPTQRFTYELRITKLGNVNK